MPYKAAAAVRQCSGRSASQLPALLLCSPPPGRPRVSVPRHTHCSRAVSTFALAAPRPPPLQARQVLLHRPRVPQRGRGQDAPGGVPPSGGWGGRAALLRSLCGGAMKRSAAMCDHRTGCAAQPPLANRLVCKRTLGSGRVASGTAPRASHGAHFDVLRCCGCCLFVAPRAGLVCDRGLTLGDLIGVLNQARPPWGAEEGPCWTDKCAAVFLSISRPVGVAARSGGLMQQTASPLGSACWTEQLCVPAWRLCRSSSRGWGSRSCASSPPSTPTPSPPWKSSGTPLTAAM